MKFFKANLVDISRHPDSRWDSEYMCFVPYKSKRLSYVSISDVLLSSQYGLSIKMNEEKYGTNIYRMNEISNMMCNRDVLKYAPITQEQIESYKLHDRDVLFNRTNSQAFVGRTGLFRKFSSEDFVFASYLVRLNSNANLVTPEYLTTFLNTKFGIRDVKRRARISINQSNVNAEELKLIEIPLVSHGLQSKITTAFDNAFDLVQKSEITFQTAQTVLISELSLTDWLPKNSLCFLKNHTVTKQNERIDAEYYQPQYEEVVKAIKSYSGGWNTLKNMVDLKSQKYHPKDEQKYRYIELANIGRYSEIMDCITEEGQNLPTRARRKICTGDVIVSSIEGSLDSIALIEQEYNQALCSNGFHVVSPKEFNSETLLVLLKSIIGQLQLKRGCSGTILAAISEDEFDKIILPKIRATIQTEIQRKVIESFSLRKQSKHLLKCAKRAVEIAIEQDEQTAIEWLESKATI